MVYFKGKEYEVEVEVRILFHVINALNKQMLVSVHRSSGSGDPQERDLVHGECRGVRYPRGPGSGLQPRHGEVPGAGDRVPGGGEDQGHGGLQAHPDLLRTAQCQGPHGAGGRRG